MSHSLAINKNFTAHQNKDVQSVPNTEQLTVYTVNAKNSLICLKIYILKQRAEQLLVWNNAPPHIRRLSHMESNKFIVMPTKIVSLTLNALRTGSFKLFKRPFPGFFNNFNPLNAELNPICYLLTLFAHHFLHVSRIRVKLLTLRLLLSYIYGAPILDVSRSHTTTQHSR